jgi:hypothetical protein
MQPNFGYLGLFRRRNSQLDCRIVSQAVSQQSEHLRCALAGRADDEDVPELLFVGAIACRERVENVIGCAVHAGLLALG